MNNALSGNIGNQIYGDRIYSHPIKFMFMRNFRDPLYMEMTSGKNHRHLPSAICALAALLRHS